MKLDFCNMERDSSHTSIFGIGIPTRKLNRYDLDDFAQSMTPNREGGNCLSLGSNVPRENSEKTNKELGSAEEKSSSLTSITLQLEKDFQNTKPVASLSVDLSGIKLEPPTNLNQETSDNVSENQPIAAPIDPNRFQRRRKSSLLEGSNLDRDVLIRAFQSFGPHPSDPVPALVLPKIDPVATEIRQRKKSAPPSLNPMMMEPQKHLTSFFFRGSNSQLAVPQENVVLSKSNQNIPNIPEVQPVMDAPVKQRRKRKVNTKNSPFAELNMFCPPSM